MANHFGKGCNCHFNWRFFVTSKPYLMILTILTCGTGKPSFFSPSHPSRFCQGLWLSQSLQPRGRELREQSKASQSKSSVCSESEASEASVCCYRDPYKTARRRECAIARCGAARRGKDGWLAGWLAQGREIAPRDSSGLLACLLAGLLACSLCQNRQR